MGDTVDGRCSLIETQLTDSNIMNAEPTKTSPTEDELKEALAALDITRHEVSQFTPQERKLAEDYARGCAALARASTKLSQRNSG
jgi:hypothetical protein